ncbi:hypothetical protein HMPREF1548_06672 [Clostridium sp. KLE 1755]|nr:hypothetical protein HMPREF1548_06672 [Clostridium sp. KLE 1755]
MLRNTQNAQEILCGPSGRKRGKVHSKNGTDSERKTVLILSPEKLTYRFLSPHTL